MENYYDRLGISRNASTREIKAAYKKLAFKYHPDRNPSNPKAEELFKLINAAYHILNDPVKKARYDLLLSYGNYQPQKVTYYQPQTFRTYPPIRRRGTYTIDRNYFKYQAIAILVVLCISAIVISITRLNRYLDERERQLVREENSRILATAQNKYNTGDFYGALQIVQNLASQHPTDFQLYIERDEMVENLYQKARRQYVLQDYNNAIFNLLIVKEFQKPLRMETWDYLAKCYLATSEYKRAAAAYEYIYLRDTLNMELVLRLAKIYHYDLHDLNKALKYYSRGKKLFKERQKHLYGDAFELLMDPHSAPDIYFNIFFHRAKANMEAGNYEIAVTDCNWATFLRPNHGESYYLRAKSYKIINENKRACKDYKKAIEKGYLAKEDLKFCIF